MVMQIILWTLLIVLVSIIPLTVAIYWKKLRYKKYDITNLLSGKLGIKYLDAYYPETPEEKKDGNKNDALLLEKLNKVIEYFFKSEYTPIKYIVPLTSLVFISGIILFLFTVSHFRLVILSSVETSFLQAIPIVIYLGFWGAFISSLIDMYKKYNTMDLTPCFLYSVNAKILLCSVLAYIWSIIFAADIAKIVSFGIGLFSISFIQKQIKKMTIQRLGEKLPFAKTSDLSQLQGLNPQIIDRLEEENIHNCQSLAYCDPIKILFKTHYQLKIILDWIDQALLYNYIGEKIKDLRPIGIRGIIEFAILHEKVDDNVELITSVGNKIGAMPKEVLKNFLDAVYNDPHIQFIWYLFSESSGADE